jgi:hypothetical protein
MAWHGMAWHGMAWHGMGTPYGHRHTPQAAMSTSRIISTGSIVLAANLEGLTDMTGRLQSLPCGGVRGPQGLDSRTKE